MWILETFPQFSEVLNVSAEREKSIPYCVRWISTNLAKVATRNQVEEVGEDRKLVYSVIYLMTLVYHWVTLFIEFYVLTLLMTLILT